MAFAKFWLFPFIKDGQSGKQQIFRYLLFVVYVAAILFLACYMGTQPDGPSKIYSFNSEKEQFEQAEKLKPLAYAAAERQYRINSKVSSAIEFVPYKKSLVSWEKGNNFTCTMRGHTRDSFRSLISSTYILKLVYCGGSEWILMEMKEVK